MCHSLKAHHLTCTWLFCHSGRGEIHACCTAGLPHGTYEEDTFLRHWKIKLKPLDYQTTSDYLPLMETMITNKVTDSSQTESSVEGLLRLVRTCSLSLLPVLFQNQSAHRSSIIQSVSLHCFSFCFHIHHLVSAHLVELYLFLESTFFSVHDREALLITLWPFNVGPHRSAQRCAIMFYYDLWFIPFISDYYFQNWLIRYIFDGGLVVPWLALLPLSKKVLGLIPEPGAFAYSPCVCVGSSSLQLHPTVRRLDQ